MSFLVPNESVLLLAKVEVINECLGSEKMDFALLFSDWLKD